MIQNQALEFASMEILRQRRKRCCALGGSRERLRSLVGARALLLREVLKKVSY